MNFNRIPSPDSDWNYENNNQGHDDDETYGELDNEDMKLLFIIAALDAPKMLIDSDLLNLDVEWTGKAKKAYNYMMRAVLLNPDYYNLSINFSKSVKMFY